MSLRLNLLNFKNVNTLYKETLKEYFYKNFNQSASKIKCIVQQIFQPISQLFAILAKFLPKKCLPLQNQKIHTLNQKNPTKNPTNDRPNPSNNSTPITLKLKEKHQENSPFYYPPMTMTENISSKVKTNEKTLTTLTKKDEYYEKIHCSDQEKEDFISLFNEGLKSLVNEQKKVILNIFKILKLLPILIKKGIHLNEQRNKKTYQLEGGLHLFKVFEIIFSDENRKKELQEIFKKNTNKIENVFNNGIIKKFIIKPKMNTYISNTKYDFLPQGFLLNESRNLLRGLAKALKIKYENLKEKFEKLVEDQNWLDFFVFLVSEKMIEDKPSISSVKESPKKLVQISQIDLKNLEKIFSNNSIKGLLHFK
ncbi:MAG: hypothetical protein AMS24_03870 [Chlamydiae bacterium SM23_39]|nr:MAG: hypothetical protein AMS24_03870 [Chlamydiae bacterium SM23_39]